MKERITPVGLKGYEITERIKQLMGVSKINENKKNSAIELIKVGPDGKVYGIVRENHEYYIKISDKKNNILIEDFNYIGGLKNKKDEAYPTYAKAIKQLNLKFKSINEANGVSNQINVFKTDALLMESGAYSLKEMSNCCGAEMYEGMCSECGSKSYTMEYDVNEYGVDEYDEKVMKRFKDEYGDKRGKAVYYATANKQDRDPETFEKNEEIEMSEYEKHVDEMLSDDIKKGVNLGASFEKFKQQFLDNSDDDYQPISPELRKRIEKRQAEMDKENDFSEPVIPNEEDDEPNPKMENEYAMMDEDENYDPISYAKTKALDNIDWESELKKYAGSEYYQLTNQEKESIIADMKKDWSRNQSFTEGNIMDEEDEMTDKDKDFASLAPPYDKITYADKIAGATKNKNENKLSIERAMKMMDEMIDSINESKLKKKL